MNKVKSLIGHVLDIGHKGGFCFCVWLQLTHHNLRHFSFY